MTTGEALQIAKEWAVEQAKQTPGTFGVFFGGSINSFLLEAAFPQSSDIDIFFVVDESVLPQLRQRKLCVEGLVLEPSYHPLGQFKSPEKVLGDFINAYNLSFNSVIYDPTGELSRTQRTVAEGYPLLKWVLKRKENILLSLNDFIHQISTDGSIFGRVWALLWTANHIHQLPLVALLRPPTVKKAIILFHDLCIDWLRESLYSSYLELLGSSTLTESELEAPVKAFTRAYDFAVSVHRTPFFPDFILSKVSRPYMIGGVTDMIQSGYHKDSILWLLYGWTTALMAIQNDAPASFIEYEPPYDTFLASLLLKSQLDFGRKAQMARKAVEQVEQFADALIASNPRILRK